eukprot:12932298-Prorocentrum_lima.AAC.1
MAHSVPENKFAETHTRIKGRIKGIIALFVDDMVQAGAKASNVECLKAQSIRDLWIGMRK